MIADLDGFSCKEERSGIHIHARAELDHGSRIAVDPGRRGKAVDPQSVAYDDLPEVFDPRRETGEETRVLAADDSGLAEDPTGAEDSIDVVE